MAGTEPAVAATVACRQCGAIVPDIDGPIHVYVPSAPGCWAAFGELRADEMLRFPGALGNNLVVDTYMAQHPGDGSDRRDRQSVFVHLTAICAVLERGRAPSGSPDVLRAVLAGRTDYPILTRAAGPGDLNLLHVAGAADAATHDTRALAWAASVWSSWAGQQPLIRAALDAAHLT
ncbi:MAG TPA: DUF5946 family protein [Candidatus Acidoferrum sp.]|nr:DUF5946 family protein [Candidatus Acidoferrum sp.]